MALMANLMADNQSREGRQMIRRKHDGMLLKRGSKFTFRVSYEGKRYDLATGCTSEKEALAWARDFKKSGGIDEHLKNKAKAAAEAEAIQAADAARVTWERVWAVYEAQQSGKGVSAPLIANAKSLLDDFAAFATSLGLVDLTQVTEMHAAAYLKRLTDVGKFLDHKKGNKRVALSSESRVQVFKTLRAIARANAKFLPKDFASFSIKLPKVVNIKRELFTEEELVKLIDAADSVLKPIIVLCSEAGLRTGDAATLDWTEVDLRGRFLRIRTNKTGTEVTIPMSPGVQALIEVAPKLSQHVFPESAEAYLHCRQGVVQRFRALMKRLDIECQREMPGRRKASIKGLLCLRHDFATRLSRQGIRMSVAQDLLGHMSPAMTRLYMAHSTEAEKIDAIRKISR